MAYVDTWIEWKVLSQDLEQLTSQLHLVLYAVCNKSSSTANNAVRNYGYVGYDSGNRQHRYTAYDFSDNKVNCFGDHIFTVSHNDDGSKTVTVEGSWETTSAYISGGSVSGEVVLETIQRESKILSAAATTLGERCKITWVPHSRSFRYKIGFSIKDWSFETELLHPNKTTENTYNELFLPMEIANQITDSDVGQMAVVLKTYADPEGEIIVGSDDAEMTVIVPINNETVPQILKAAIAPHNTFVGFDGLYLQGRSKVQGNVVAEGKFGATVSYTIIVQGKTYSDPWLSDPVTDSGIVKIIVTDSRGFSVSRALSLTITPYTPPTLIATVVRCKADGTADNAGTYLKVQATATYSPVNGKNTGNIFYAYRAEGDADFCDPIKIRSINSGEYITEIVGGAFSKECAFQVRVMVEDTVGELTAVNIKIPSEAVYLDKPAGGKRLGVGGYCDGVDNLMDVHFLGMMRKGLILGHGVGSVFLCATDAKPSLIYGGTWQVMDTQLADCLYVWKRIS